MYTHQVYTTSVMEDDIDVLLQHAKGRKLPPALSCYVDLRVQVWIGALSIQTNNDEVVHGEFTCWNASGSDSALTKAMMSVSVL